VLGRADRRRAPGGVRLPRPRHRKDLTRPEPWLVRLHAPHPAFRHRGTWRRIGVDAAAIAAASERRRPACKPCARRARTRDSFALSPQRAAHRNGSRLACSLILQGR
jgi:hypothetical protein